MDTKTQPAAIQFQQILRQPGETRALFLMGNQANILVTGDETGSAMTIIEYVVAPRGVTPPPHRHAFAEAFYVLEGVLGVRIGDQTCEALPGSTVFIPGEMPHTWYNAGDLPARVLITCTPAGLESYFEDLHELLRQQPPGPPNLTELMPHIQALWAKYDMRPV